MMVCMDEEMTSRWARRRQIIYVSSIIGIVLLLAAYPLYRLLYSPPTCFDGKQNQEEVGVDCGGPCNVLCGGGAQTRALAVDWAKAFRVSDGVYDVAASVENPNASAGIESLSYTFSLYDSRGTLIAEKSGVVFVNPREKFLVFDSGVRTDGRAPASVEFAFEKEPVWIKMEAKPLPITVKNKKLLNMETSPRLNATLFNDSIDNVFDADVIAVVYNTAGDPIAVSSTYEKMLAKRSSQDVFFTWPFPFPTKPKTGCTAPADVMLVFDRSGSMGFAGANPVQPLTDAKNAALAFVEGMQAVDHVGLVSFATTASDPVDQPLTADHKKTTDAISAISIASPALEQHTNIGDGIEKAALELSSERGNPRAKKAIILLTDGAASRPLDPKNGSDTVYPEQYAKEKADQAKTSEVLLFAIGLGNTINEPFLKNEVATTPGHFYKAATSADLKGVYDEIAQAVCEAETFVVDVIVHTKSTDAAR